MAAKKTTRSKKVTGAEVRMYRIGTGDCFAVKFFAGETVTFKMMIDCGAQQGTAAHFSEYVSDLKDYVDNEVDVLVVTHEHTDHVLGFERCKSLFTTDFTIGETWMSWAEEDDATEVKDLKKDFGKKKAALAVATNKLLGLMNDPKFEAQQKALHRGEQRFAAQKDFTLTLSDFVALHGSPDAALAAKGTYLGGLKGMTAVKEEILDPDKTQYLHPGEILEDIPGLDGVRIYVLGPPHTYDIIKKEDGEEEGDTYEHNKELAQSEAFAAAAVATLPGGDDTGENLLPFDAACVSQLDPSHEYENPANAWRRIDHDWLMSAGSLALRLNKGINNLSLVLAIEFIESGRVMLFPGDAEFGSWASWHDIPWKKPSTNKKADGTPVPLTEDLLNRTVFYKVAHHLSHNGTAKKKGLKMMTDKRLTAMATLDYDVIDSKWKGTMPNAGILEDLLTQTRGRLMVMKLHDKMFYDAKKTIPLAQQIEKVRKRMTASEKEAFKEAHEETPLFISCRVEG